MKPANVESRQQNFRNLTLQLCPSGLLQVKSVLESLQIGNEKS